MKRTVHKIRWAVLAVMLSSSVRTAMATGCPDWCQNVFSNAIPGALTSYCSGSAPASNSFQAFCVILSHDGCIPTAYSNSSTFVSVNPTNAIYPAPGLYELIGSNCCEQTLTAYVGIVTYQLVTVSNSGPVCANQTLNLYATYVTNAAYSWTGPNGFTSTNQNPQILNPQPADIGEYCLSVACVPTQLCTTVESVAIAATIAGPTAVCSGSTTTYNGPVDPDLQYIWTISGQGSITGVTTGQTVSVQAGSTNSFTLSLTAYDNNGCSSSTNLTVSVFGAVAIGTQPVSQVICAGNTASLSVGAAGTFLSYQWLENGVDLVNAGSVSGANTATLILSNLSYGSSVSNSVPGNSTNGVSFGYVTTGSIYQYQGSGCISNHAPFFSVNPNGIGCTNSYGPNVASSPSYLCEGLTAYSLVGRISGGGCIQLGNSGTFVATSSGTLTLYFNGNRGAAVYTNYSGSWAVTISSSPMADGFDVLVSNGCSSQTSTVATVAISTACDGIPDWWLLEYFGTTNSNATTCATCDPAGDCLSNLEKYQFGVSPTNSVAIATVTGGGTVCLGQSATVQAALIGNGPWTLNWSDGVITTNSSSPALRNVNPTSTTNYAITTVSNGSCSGGIATGNAVVTVNGLPSCSIVGPSSVCALSSNSYSGTAGMISYTWTVLGNGVITGTNSQQTVSVTAGSSNAFALAVSITDSNGCSSTCSNAVTIETLPAIIAFPTNLTLCAGNPATFSVSATGAGLNYRWRKGGSGWGDLGAWNLSMTTNDSSQNGQFVFASGNIDTGGRAWGLYANNGQTANAVRPFNGAMPVGETFIIDMANNAVGEDGVVGFGLQDASGTNRFEFYFVGGQTNYFINDGDNAARSGPLDTGAAYASDGIHLELLLTGPDTYAFTLLYQDGTILTTNGDLEGVSGSGIAQVRLFNVNAGPGTNSNLYFNNIQVDGKSDNAGDAAYNNYDDHLSWETGYGGGWVLDGLYGASSNYGWFIGSSTNNGGGNPGNDGKIDTAGSRAWGLWAANGAISEAQRAFNTPMNLGDTFRMAFANGWINNGDSTGFGLQDSVGTNRFEFYFGGGSSHYSIHDSTGLTRDTGVPWTDQGLSIAFTLTGTDSYSVVISAATSNTYGLGNTGSLPVTVTGTLAGTDGNLIDRMRLFNFSTGTGPHYYTFFNSISVGSKSDNASDPAYTNGWNSGTDGGQSLNVASGPNLSIAAVQFNDAGVYDSIISGTCGSAVTSTPAALMVPMTGFISGPSTLNVQCTAVYSAPWLAGLTYDWSVSSNATILSGSTSVHTVMVQALDTNSFTIAFTGTNGNCASTITNAVTVQNQPGLAGAYYSDQFFTDLAFVRLDSAIDFDWTGTSPDPALIGVDHYSIRWTGQFQAQYSETYTFTTVSDDGVRLWIGDQVVVDNWTDHDVTTNSGTITLVAGQIYNIRLDYYQDIGSALIHLWWSSPSQSQQVMPFTQPVVLDSIPGVPNALASALGLTGLNPAALSGAVSMAEQIFQTFNNPLTNDLDGTVNNVVVVNGSQTNNALGLWQVDGSEIYAIDRRGYVEYQVTTPSTNVYRLVVTGRENSPDLTEESQFDLPVYVDGEYLGRQTLMATQSGYSAVHYYTPWLLPGSHTIRIFWDNAASVTSLRIQSLMLQTLGGPVNSSGVYNWVTTRLQKMCGLDLSQPTNNFVSPLSLEGRGGFLSMMNLTATDPSTGASTNVLPQGNAGYVLYAADTSIPPHTGERWYANVPLSFTTGTVIAASYQNGGLIQTNTVTWSPLNVLAAQSMTIRLGDSLLLSAMPDGTNFTGVFSIGVGANTYQSTNVSPLVPYQFTQPGSNIVTATFFGADGSQESNSITIVVDNFIFSSNPDCWQETTRTWNNTNINGQVVFQNDPRFLEFQETGVNTNNGLAYGITIDQNELRSVVSRTVTNGPILAAATANGFRLYATPETYNVFLTQYSDGSRLLETMLVLSPVLPDISLQVNIIVGGVTFEDGTTTKTLTSADFDPLGQVKLHFLMPNGVYSANCYTINVIQGTNDLVGVYY